MTALKTPVSLYAESLATFVLKKILLKTYENPPADFQVLLSTEGVGAKTLRALALVSELIYGTKTSTGDFLADSCRFARRLNPSIRRGGSGKKSG